jgi:glycosyltransferase involved in cell wall biosynthesis
MDKKKVLIFSHSDYINSIGGTQKYIYEQAYFLTSTGLEVIQVFPKASYHFYDKKPSSYATYINHRPGGSFSIGNLMQFLKRNINSIKVAYIHNLVFWKYNDIKSIMRMLRDNGIKIIFYVHDIFCCCPGIYTMDIFKNINNCILKNNSSAAPSTCLKCPHYGSQIGKWRQDFKNIFALADKIIIPSEFITNKLLNIYPKISRKITVRGHLNLANKTPIIKPKINWKIRIAYLGYNCSHKGWDIWNKLYQYPNINRSFTFYHIGTNNKYAYNVIPFSYSYKANGIMAATDILVKNDINLVLLWSTVPESYSYTMYEAMAAGVPILTNEQSGNIAYTIKKYGDEIGRCFKNENALFSFLLNKNQVNDFINKKRYRYVVKSNQHIDV